MALGLGAEYRGQWVSEATHLLAAFDGTDKTSAARRTGGAVVQPEWLRACADRDAYLATPRPETSLAVDLSAAFAASFALAFRRRRMALYCFAFTYTAASVVGNKTLECARARA